MSKRRFSMVWNLDNLFPDTSESSKILDHLKQLEIKINELEEELDNLGNLQDINEAYKIESILKYTGNIRVNQSQANSFITCLLAQDPKDQDAMKLREQTSSINARFDSAIKKFQSVLLGLDQRVWDTMLEEEALKNNRYILTEWRKKSEMFLSSAEEKIISDLMVDGFHAWGQFYNSLLSGIKVKIDIDSETKELSVGQTINLRSHPNEQVRKKAHYALEDIWKEREDLFAQILNHIAGFRLQVYQKRGLNDVLAEPLLENRLEEDTLNAMWTAVSKYKQPFIQYLNRKAEMNGDKKMQSYNFWAPIAKSNQEIEYEDAVPFILEQFSHFGNELESFTQHVFDNGWVEAEDRSNKSSIAFCAGFPLSEESRIFMTYGGRITSVLTLAHELGHAFHNYAMKNVDGLHRKYPLSIAETASTFSEQIMLDAALEKAETPEEKIAILDEKLKRSVMNFMNIHSRFLFEKRFYEERKEGMVSPARLNEMMQQAIDEAYDCSFENASLHSWVWTPHFYITSSPFYNFPYTFGYLFSLCLYAKAKEKGKEFEKQYLELLRDSGSMSTEDLVMKHLEEDITSEEFWKKGLETCAKDAEEFITLTNSLHTSGIHT
ncbi:M3 family oligoendopeptidase [Bacillus sp. JJ1521]|uniref:M3 family oligoendopeptidase n=1 Tax=Bacillus sp. JJ1521 TaxID=3122957 RepID=UPI002FFF8E2A